MKKRGGSTLRKILRFAVNGVIALFAVNAAAIVLLLIFGIRAYVVRTGSMEPEIKTGSICFVDSRAEFADIKQGDVITFSVSKGTAVTHRAVRIEDGCVYTKGDANNAEDEEAVTQESFIGKCVFNIPMIGNAVRFLRSPYGIVAVVMLIILLIAGDHLLDRKETSA